MPKMPKSVQFIQTILLSGSQTFHGWTLSLTQTLSPRRGLCCLLKKVDMKSIVPYSVPRNEYFEPATVVDRAASALRGGCGLIIRLQEFSNPIADKTGAGVFAFYKHKKL